MMTATATKPLPPAKPEPANRVKIIHLQSDLKKGFASWILFVKVAGKVLPQRAHKMRGEPAKVIMHFIHNSTLLEKDEHYDSDIVEFVEAGEIADLEHKIVEVVQRRLSQGYHLLAGNGLWEGLDKDMWSVI